jgi:hypothetical protein
MGWALSDVAPLFRWVSKHVSGNCAVGKTMKRWGYWESDNCPCCQTPTKTSRHVVTCTNDRIKVTRQAQLHAFRGKLQSMETHEDIERCFMHALSDPSHLFATHATPFIAQAVESQDKIGWFNFLEGRIAVEWRQLQDQHYRNTGSSHHGKRWAMYVIQELLGVIHWIPTKQAYYDIVPFPRGILDYLRPTGSHALFEKVRVDNVMNELQGKLRLAIRIGLEQIGKQSRSLDSSSFQRRVSLLLRLSQITIMTVGTGISSTTLTVAHKAVTRLFIRLWQFVWRAIIGFRIGACLFFFFRFLRFILFVLRRAVTIQEIRQALGLGGFWRRKRLLPGKALAPFGNPPLHIFGPITNTNAKALDATTGNSHVDCFVAAAGKFSVDSLEVAFDYLGSSDEGAGRACNVTILVGGQGGCRIHIQITRRASIAGDRRFFSTLAGSLARGEWWWRHAGSSTIVARVRGHRRCWGCASVVHMGKLTHLSTVIVVVVVSMWLLMLCSQSWSIRCCVVVPSHGR